MRGWVPHKQTGRRRHVDEAADGDHVFDHVGRQAVERRDGIHPVVGGVVPATDATVGGDVEHVGGFGKAVDDVGGQAGNETSVTKLGGQGVEHLNARWTPAVAGQPNDELVVVGVHRVELPVKRAAHRRNGAGGGVKFEHTTGVGRNEQVRSVQVEITGHRVAGERPSVLPFYRSVGQEGPLEQTGSGATKVSRGRRRSGRGP